MASQCKVQDIKRKFESLIVENKPAIVNQTDQLCKQSYTESFAANCLVANSNLESESDEESTKTTLSRQPSDPSKKLHRSHAFRCERTQKIRHSDSNNSENDFLARMCEKKLSKDRLKRLGNVLEDRMRWDSFKPDLIPQNNIVNDFRELIHNSVPDDKVPKNILDQYAKVNKKNEPKKDSTVDSGVGSETENLDDEKYGQIRKTNLNLNESNSDDTIRLEKKNPHVVLTDTLKKALKQPLPVGPPPEKPPRTFTSSPAQEKKSTKHMLNRLEEELLKREAKEKEKRPKELHYMCTEILDIHQRSLPNPKPVNCAMKYNTSTLPGHLNGVRNLTKKTDEHTYDIPFDESTEKENEQINVATNFEKIRSNFENGFQKSKTVGNSNGRTADTKFKHVNIEVGRESPRQRQCDFKNGRKFGTEVKRYRRNEKNDRLLSLPKKCNKMDAERETLYRLMDEIYATVKVGNTMDDDRLGSSTDGSTTDESVKITRSLTEKRKNYVRGISCRIAYLDPKNIKNVRSKTITCTYKDVENPYSTHRSWKSFRTSQKDLSQKTLADSTDSCELSMDDRRVGIDEKTGCLDIELCFEPREKGLFNVCMLVGFNFMNNQAYVKSVFPEQVIPPPHIESLIFPETLSSEDRVDWTPDGVSAQCYSLVLTDEKGERSYGYCRRVLPEGASACLPLAYCLIGKYRAPGFYYKVLQEIESLHGNSDLEMDSVLQQLFETDFPEPGEEIVLTYKDQTMNNMQIKNQIRMADMKRSKTMLELRRRKRDNSPGEQILGRDEAVTGREYSEMPAKRRILTKRETNSLLPDYYDLENNNRPTDTSVVKHIKRPLEPRVDENNLSTLLDSLGAGLSIKVFASLLLERKVFIIGDKLSEVSSCIEALQSVLYPFVWQQPLISSVPAAIQQDMLDAPLPILAGVLRRGTHAGLDLTGVQFEGMLIDLSATNKVLFCEGDESTILPTHSYKSLKTSLQMWSNKHRDKHEDKQSRNLLISEAFLRFFVEILGDFSKCFSVGELKEGGFGKAGTVFDKETFIKSAVTKQNQHFLEWFTETAMFNHFIQNMAVLHSAGQSEASTQSKMAAAGQSQRLDLVDTPLPNFYEVFNDRLKSGNRTSVQTKKSLVFLKNKMKDMLVKFQK